jgi:ribosome-binding protein aMBF1 (putative translation factor)
MVYAMDGQDWKPVTLHHGSQKQRPSAVGGKSEKDEKPKNLTSESRQAIALTRVTKKWTQKELDQKGPFPPGSSNAWEAGRICPTGPQINLLQRILGIKLARE